MPASFETGRGCQRLQRGG